ncbi:MAG: secretion protein, partial [Paramuribaculum sp.]|nr:secretion protein [Paramuribaculum sp.]
MFWEGRGAGGTSSLARQQYYLNQCETFFTNGVRNPAVHLATINNKAHRPNENWQGISTYRNAASTINHTIAQEAFYSFFNLGNGTFFNWKGKRISDNEWYSLGIQDFMPTWRFWFAPKFMQATVAKGSQGLQADFTWEDAYVGGSCLKISGSADTEYLHLFKSAIIPNANNKIVVRYRLLNGEADINLVLSTGNAPSTVKHTLKGVLTVAESSAKADQSFDVNSTDRWVTKVFNLSQVQANAYKSTAGGIGVIGLEFKNAKNLELLLGEFGIYPSGSATATEEAISNSQTPAAPQITKTTILASNQYGVDAKMVWTMDGGKGRAAGTPVYNADVNASMYKMYAQEEGGEETFVGATTSWAGLLYKCPVTLGSNKKVRFGVSAVSADTRTESAISWSAYMAKPDYALNDNITIDKPVLKANESFSFGFIDPQHAPADWTLVDESGKTVLTASGHTIQVPNGLPEEGGYTLYINKGQDTERVFGYYVQVSGDKVGAVPEIYTVTRDGETIT